jgi:hypothetical protein
MNTGEKITDNLLLATARLPTENRNGTMLPDGLPELNIESRVDYKNGLPGELSAWANGYEIVRVKLSDEKAIPAFQAEVDKVCTMNMAQLDNYLKPLREAKDKANMRR